MAVNDFGRLLEQEIPRLKRYARALTRDSARADDLMQSALERALTKQHLWESGTNLRAWLFTILHNQHVNDVRRSAREGQGVAVEEVEPTLTTVGRQYDTLMLRDLERFLGQLPEEQRQVILLVGLEGMEYEAAAGILGVPIGTVRSRISRGRAMLRLLMEGTARTKGSEPTPHIKTRLAFDRVPIPRAPRHAPSTQIPAAPAQKSRKLLGKTYLLARRTRVRTSAGAAQVSVWSLES